MKVKRLKQLITISALLAITVSCTSSNGGYEAGYYKSDSPKELTVAWTEAGKVVDTVNLPTVAKSRELTNIGLKNVLPKTVTDWQQALGMLVATNKEPDIMHFFSEKVINQYIINGTLRPLDDLIEMYAPNLSAFFEENPELKRAAQWKDGKIYYIPCYADGVVSDGWFIRKDWLDKLGLSEPQSVEDYYEVLKAFKNGDPNGNGIADEIPYFSRKSGVNYTDSILSLLYLWDVNRSIIEKDGKIVFAPCEPEYIEAVSNIAKWYREGLIDPEIYTRGSSARDELLSSNVGGSTYDWFGSNAKYNDSLSKTIDGFEFVPIAPPNGAVYTRRDLRKSAGWGISSKSENEADAIRYMDFWFSSTGRILANYGIEGETYDMIDGKPILKESIVNSYDEGSIVDELNAYGAQLNMGYHQDFDYELQWLTPIALQGIDSYLNNGYLKKFVNKSFTLGEQDLTRVTELTATLEDYVDDMEQKWILGKLDIESTYNEFLSTLHKMQVDELLDIYNKAYESAE